MTARPIILTVSEMSPGSFPVPTRGRPVTPHRGDLVLTDRSRVALKQRHGKTDDGSKYAGTLIGKCIEHGDILVEGGEFPSIQRWNEKMRAASQRPPGSAKDNEKEKENGDGGGESRPASSGLSSLGDRSIGDYEDMMDSL